jgi:hypothetical protein
MLRHEEGVWDQDEGLPLAEALKVYGDLELLAAYQSARAQFRGIPPRLSWLQDSRWVRERWSNRYEEAERAARDAVDRASKALVAEFRVRLISGELIATGYEAPASLDIRGARFQRRCGRSCALTSAARPPGGAR